MIVEMRDPVQNISNPGVETQIDIGQSAIAAPPLVQSSLSGMQPGFMLKHKNSNMHSQLKLNISIKNNENL